MGGTATYLKSFWSLIGEECEFGELKKAIAYSSQSSEATTTQTHANRDSEE
ncbi:MAG: hypothetical protein KME08_18965 [Aphanothece sp. CMT-3BRIN-NPC111]|nr:hypothetical protein [Aphanothece sp. CMT-3BRIN-NPC111]